MAYDAHKNFATSLVATAPSPASSGTSLVVTAADGAKFPAVSFNATVWPANTKPTTTNAEIVRVTAISTDTFTITRAQESSSARTIVVGDQIAATITTKALTDVEAPAAYSCGLYTTALSHTSSGSSQVVSFNSAGYEVYDPSGMHDPSSNTSRITILKAGAYMVTANVYWTDNATGLRITEVKLNNATTIGRAAGGMDSGGRSGQTVVFPYTFALNDYIELNPFQNSGGNLAYVTVSFSAAFIGV